MSLPEPALKPIDIDVASNRPTLPMPSPSRRSITLSAPSGEYGPSSANKRASGEVLNSVEFVPPAEGTPAALALAANAAIKVSRLDRGFHKLRTMKRPKMKSLNLVKKLNKMTKQRRDKRHFSKNFKGKVIDGVHELYTLTAGMMLGIRFSLVRGYELEAYHDNHSRHEDFEEIENVAFPPKGSTTPPYITPPHSLVHTFKFKSYAPKIFKQLREFFDIDPVDYMNSVCGDYNYLEFISNSKSGQFFFYSHDGKYMLKTQTKEENKFLKQILPQYYKYLKENPHSLLVRILGMHRIKMYHLRRKVHFVIMSSVFDTAAQINTIYDLKGSLVGRSATEKERASGGVLKDCDLIADHRKLHLGPKKLDFMRQLNSDAKFLSSLHVMDYSLLVGIHNRKTRTTELNTITLNPSNAVTPVASVQKEPTPTAHSNSSIHISTTSTAPANERPAPLLHQHSNTPFRRSIHDGIGLPPTAPTSRRASYQANSSKRNPEDSSTTATSDHDHYLDYNNVYLHDMKDQFENNHQSLSSVSGLHESENANGHTNHGVQIAMASASSDRAENQGPGLTINTSQARRRSSHEGDKSVVGIAGEGVLEREVLLENNFDEPALIDSDNEDDDDDDGDYDDIDEGDSDISEEPETSHLHNSTPFSPPLYSNFPTTMQPGQPAVDEEKPDENLSHNDSQLPISKRFEILYGNGITTRRPWTKRRDLGINGHNHQGERVDDIYFVGIIDILQEYNTSKRMETMMKGLTNDSRLISSVDPVTYAQRFVKFMDANID